MEYMEANKSYNSTVDLFNTIKKLIRNIRGLKNREDSRSYNNSVNLNYELKQIHWEVN